MLQPHYKLLLPYYKGVTVLTYFEYSIKANGTQKLVFTVLQDETDNNGTNMYIYDGNGEHGGKYRLSNNFLDSIKEKASSGVLLGDSTIADRGVDQTGLDQLLLTPSEILAGTTVHNLAVSGHNITDQLAVWQADTNKATYDWIIVQVGINSLAYLDMLDYRIAEYQAFIDEINTTKKSSAKVILSTMIPCRQRFIDLEGLENGIIIYTFWTLFNQSIMGGGANPITGVDYRINNHTTALDDGSGNLAITFDTGDGVHYNNLGRVITASSYRQILNNIGFLKSTTPTTIENYYAPAGKKFGDTVVIEGNMTTVAPDGGGIQVAGLGSIIWAASPSNGGSFTIQNGIGNGIYFLNGATYSMVLTSNNSVAIGGITTHASSIFDLISTTKGARMPCMTKAQRDAILSPVQGLEVFVTDNGGYKSWYNSGWHKVSSVAD